jgi:hypothetical protein
MTIDEKEYQRLYRKKHKLKFKEYAQQYYLKNKDRILEVNLKKKHSNPERILWQSARDRAIKFDLPFDIDVSDVVIPSHCKILGIPLFKGVGKPTANSPSLDRIDPKLGYVKNNIQIISFKANTIKSNATREELIIFSYWILENYLD